MTTAVFPYRPRFIFREGGDQIDWSMILPSRPWEPTTPTIGGSRTAAGGVPAAYVVRRDYNLIVPLRFYEQELTRVNQLIEWGQDANTFLFYPDANDTASSFQVYLEYPKAGEEWKPNRDPNFLAVFELSIRLRAIGGTGWIIRFLENLTFTAGG